MSTKKQKIVLIEDQKSHADYITSVLDCDRFEVKVFREGQAAKQYLLKPQKHPDLVLVDNLLPDMEGVEIIEYFVKKNYGYAFVILTGSNSINLAVKAMKIGAMDYISKSLDLKEELELVVVKTIKLNKERSAKTKLEKQLKEKEAELKEINATKEKLFSIIAHDLKSPLGSVIGYADLLLKNLQKYDLIKTEEFVSNIHATAENTYNLLENLLSWVNNQKGMVNFEPVQVMLNPIIKEITKVLGTTAKLKKITLKSNVDSGVEVFADKNMLKAILLNLVTNAIKFTNAGGVVTLDSNVKSNDVEIVVSDTGIGIDDATLKNLFKLHKGRSNPGTKGEKGSGLGLLISKDFIENHNGSIYAESKLGVGSRFRFILPNKK